MATKQLACIRKTSSESEPRLCNFRDEAYTIAIQRCVAIVYASFLKLLTIALLNLVDIQLLVHLNRMVQMVV